MDKRYFGTKRQNDSGEILRDLLNTVPVKKKKKKSVFWEKEGQSGHMQSYVKELKLLMKDYLLIRMHLFEIG